LLLQTVFSDWRQTRGLPVPQTPLAQPLLPVHVEPSGPWHTPPVHVAPDTEQSLEVRQVPPLAFFAQVPLEHVPDVQSLALLQAPPGEEITQTPLVQVPV
jgi:hypothetical protein